MEGRAGGDREGRAAAAGHVTGGGTSAAGATADTNGVCSAGGAERQGGSVGQKRRVRGCGWKETPGMLARRVEGVGEAATGDEGQGQRPAASTPEDGRAAPASQKG